MLINKTINSDAKLLLKLIQNYKNIPFQYYLIELILKR